MTMATKELTVEEAKTELDAAQSRVDALRKKQTELTERIDELADCARSGQSSGLSEMQNLAIEKGEADRSLEDAEDALETAQQRLADVTAATDRERFVAVISELKQAREEFTALLRTSCVLLGRIIKLKTEAGELASSQVTVTGTSENPAFYRDPFVLQSMKEVVNRRLPSASDFIGSTGPHALVGDMHLGWNVAVQICPLHPREHEITQIEGGQQ